MHIVTSHQHDSKNHEKSTPKKPLRIPNKTDFLDFNTTLVFLIL